VKTFRFAALLSVLVAFVPLTRAVTIIYPVEAIDDLWTLASGEFQQKYAGINITGLGPTDEGWYVRYRHENLTYLFGPVAGQEEARRKKWEMEAVRDAAIRNHQALSTSQVDFVRFTFSGNYGRGGGAENPYGGRDPDGRGGADRDGEREGLAKDGSGADGRDGRDGDKQGGAEGQKGEQLAGLDGNQRGQDGKQDGSTGQQAGAAGQQGDQRRVASANQRGSQSGSQNQQGQQSQSGQQGQQSQSGQQGQQSSQGSQSSSQSSQAGGQPGQPGPPMSGSSGGGNPILALLRMILGI
jgi:hypothetical protein